MIKFVMVRKNSNFDENQFLEIINAIGSKDSTLEKCTTVSRSSTTCEFRLEYKGGRKYYISCEIVTHKIVQLVITIEPQREMEEYDFQLERIKIRLKDFLIKTWNSCVWLVDSQVLELSASLYTNLHKTENRVREFINNFMTKLFGVTWWEDYVQPNLRSIYNTHKLRQGAYKRDVPSFANVDDSLLSINTDDLWSLMRLKVTKWEPIEDPNLESAIRDGRADKVLELSQKQLRVVLDIWEKYLKPCFDERFEREWGNFTRNRNHIAHNKLIDHGAYKKIEENIRLIYAMIDNAEKKFSELHLSNEEIQQLLKYASEHGEEEHIGIIADVKIYSESDIKELFIEKLSEFQTEISDELYFRRDLEIEMEPINNSDPRFISISSKLLEDEKISIVCKFEIVNGRGDTSFCVIELIDKANKVLEDCKLEFMNGDYEFDEETGYTPRVEAHLDVELLENFYDSALEIINEKFPNLVEELETLKYLSVKDGVEGPVADFPCSECGEFTVSITEELWEIGVCVSCGTKHSLGQCLRCENYYDADAWGRESLCESCLEYIRAQ